MADVDEHPDLASIRAPCLVAHRRGDVTVPVANGRALAEAIPGAEYVELPGSDHLWWTRGQDALIEAIERFSTRPRQELSPGART
jgi:pimeloyl-ACP methyl ester carboxylesterase